MTTLLPVPPAAGALDAIASHYSSSLADHGVVSQSVGWKDPGQQIRRFRELARVIPADDSPFTVADYGCGYGAMCGWLDATFPGRMTSYVGLDISDDMLAAARATVADPRAQFVRSATLDTPADFVFVSGTFNLRLAVPATEWQAQVDAMVDQLWSQARRGLAFNLLTSHVDWEAEGLFYADPARFLSRSLQRHSRWSTLIHDYPMYEWTLLITRAPLP